jgi:ABC-type polysaccharide/polyol phosphate export permease
MNVESPEELERQIEHTRKALDETLSALRLELSPRHHLEVAWESTKQRTRRSLHAGADWAGANPVAVVAAMFAVGGALGAGLVKSFRRGH